MVKKISIFIICSSFCLLFSCKPSIKAENLYGKWKYVKVENPNANPPDSISRMELEEQSPNIQFFKNSKLEISWGGKTLSHGQFRIDGDNIRFRETLPDGKSREFPFYVSKLTDKDLVFETTGAEGSKVTAVRVSH